MRSLFPAPHVDEQKLHIFHAPQLPSTVKSKEMLGNVIAGYYGFD